MLRLNSGDLRDINSKRNSVVRMGSRGKLTPSKVSRKLNTVNRPKTAMNQRGLAQNSHVASSMKKIDRLQQSKRELLMASQGLSGINLRISRPEDLMSDIVNIGEPPRSRHHSRKGGSRHASREHLSSLQGRQQNFDQTGEGFLPSVTYNSGLQLGAFTESVSSVQENGLVLRPISTQSKTIIKANSDLISNMDQIR